MSQVSAVTTYIATAAFTDQIRPKGAYEKFVNRALDPNVSKSDREAHKAGMIALAVLLCIVTLGFGAFLVKKVAQVFSDRQKLIDTKVAAATHAVLAQEAAKQTALPKSPSAAAPSSGRLNRTAFGALPEVPSKKQGALETVHGPMLSVSVLPNTSSGFTTPPLSPVLVPTGALTRQNALAASPSDLNTLTIASRMAEMARDYSCSHPAFSDEQREQIRAMMQTFFEGEEGQELLTAERRALLQLGELTDEQRVQVRAIFNQRAYLDLVNKIAEKFNLEMVDPEIPETPVTPVEEAPAGDSSTAAAGGTPASTAVAGRMPDSPVDLSGLFDDEGHSVTV